LHGYSGEDVILSRYKALIDYEKYDRPAPSDEAAGENGDNPMILPPSVWRNTVINFDHLWRTERRALKRVPCFGPVVFYNRKGKIAALGDMKDLNEKSGGFEIMPVNMKVNDVFYLEFLRSPHFILTQVQVVIRRISVHGNRTKIGVEFVDATPAFVDKLNAYLAEEKAHLDGFEEVEII
jgi:PilZ domain